MPFDAGPVAIEALPLFKPRRNQRRLDLRPVAWSLRNRPDEWEWLGSSNYRIVHKPSAHQFWVANGITFYDLYHADCSCTSRVNRRHRKPSIADRLRFHFAFKGWERRADETAAINRQFAAHFITPADEGRA